MQTEEFLGKRVQVRVDRPLGSTHPTHGFVYPVNYGYLPGVMAEDGEELDAYILGVDQPLTDFAGWVIAVIHRLDDVEDKLVVAPEESFFSKAEIAALTFFTEQYFKPQIVMAIRD